MKKHGKGANSVILTPDRRFLFATNGGDNSVSSFAVGVDGTLDIVKKHVSHVLSKLGAANRPEAVTRARQLGLIP